MSNLERKRQRLEREQRERERKEAENEQRLEVERQRLEKEENDRVQAAAEALRQLGFGRWPTQPEYRVRVQTAVGHIETFNVGQDWSIYEERLEQYLLANFVEEERRVPVLLSVIGQEAYEKLKDLCDPDLPRDKTLEELCTILRHQFTPRVSVFKERKEFFELKQTEGETVKNWYARIKKKAASCKFGALLNDYIKDKFVTGLLQGKILDRMCEESHTVTMEQVMNIALAKEAALATTKDISAGAEINKVGAYKNFTKPAHKGQNQQ